MLPSAQRALATLWSPRKRRNEKGDHMVALFSLGAGRSPERLSLHGTAFPHQGNLPTELKMSGLANRLSHQAGKTAVAVPASPNYNTFCAVKLLLGGIRIGQPLLDSSAGPVRSGRESP